MDKTNYIVIQGWMLALPLTASELLAYALIWGYSQDGESDYHGSVTHLAEWCRVGRRQALDILRHLVELGWVTKKENPGRSAHYRAVPDGGCAEIAHVQKLHGGCAEIAPLPPHTPLSRNNQEIFKNSLDSPRVREDLQAFGEYVRMTAAEHDKLAQRFGAADATRLCEILDAYLAKKPGAYKSHYRAALGWPVQRLQEEKLTQQRMKNAREAGLRAAGQPVRTTNYAALAEADARRKAIEDKYKDK